MLWLPFAPSENHELNKGIKSHAKQNAADTLVRCEVRYDYPSSREDDPRRNTNKPTVCDRIESDVTENRNKVEEATTTSSCVVEIQDSKNGI